MLNKFQSPINDDDLWLTQVNLQMIKKQLCVLVHTVSSVSCSSVLIHGTSLFITLLIYTISSNFNYSLLIYYYCYNYYY